MQIKQSVFAELDAATPGHAILASNTSSLSITEIGEATLRPDRVVGFHYFYPASLMPLIEVVEGEETSGETVTAAVTFAQTIRKQPITCAEVPGFVVNRILNSGTSEIWREQERHGLSIKAIDEGVGAAGVIPMGPYFLVNLLGLDTVLHVAEHLAESYGDERFYVPSGMQKLVGEGRLLETMADFDIGIAPLADTAFNHARSDVKLKEYGSVGAAWLASPVGAYCERGGGDGGRLVGDGEWFDALDGLIRSGFKRRRLSRQALKWARAQTIDRFASQWEEEFTRAMERGRARGGSPSAQRHLPVRG